MSILKNILNKFKKPSTEIKYIYIGTDEFTDYTNTEVIILGDQNDPEFNPEFEEMKRVKSLKDNFEFDVYMSELEVIK